MVFVIINASLPRDQIICKKHSYQTQTDYLFAVLTLIHINPILQACLSQLKTIYSIHLFLNFEHQGCLLFMFFTIKRGCIDYHIGNEIRIYYLSLRGVRNYPWFEPRLAAKQYLTNAHLQYILDLTFNFILYILHCGDSNWKMVIFMNHCVLLFLIYSRLACFYWFFRSGQSYTNYWCHIVWRDLSYSNKSWSCYTYLSHATL